MNEQLYIRAFNAGYLMSSYLPKLFEQLSRQHVEHSKFFSGFVDGGKEQEREMRLRSLEELKGKDNIELDMNPNQ